MDTLVFKSPNTGSNSGSGMALVTLHFDSSKLGPTLPTEKPEPGHLFPQGSSVFRFSLTVPETNFLFAIEDISDCEYTRGCAKTQTTATAQGKHDGILNENTLAVPILFDTPMNFYYVMEAKTGGIGSTATMDGTVYWKGLSLFDSRNNPVSNINVTSISGTNYLNNFASAIPEPEIVAMLLGGLALISVISRRKRQNL
jgi:hypothetical protein